MNKSDIIEELAVQYSLPKKKAEIIVQAIFEEMIAALQHGDRIEFRGFGTFSAKEYDGYVGRNPNSGESAVVPSKRRVRFRMSEVLFERINQHFEQGDA